MTFTHRSAFWRLRAPLVLVAAALAALAVAPASLSRADAEPSAYQLWTSNARPGEGRVFVGATVMLLSRPSVTLRPDSVRFSCRRGVIRSRSKRTPVRYAPVTTVRIGPKGNEPGPVIGVWTCVWRLPAGTAGRRLISGYKRRAIGIDPVTGEETGRVVDGGTLTWTIVR